MHTRAMDSASPPEWPQRKRLRLAGFDYAEARSYFVTIVVVDRRCLFGEVTQGRMSPSHAGEMVVSHWQALAVRFSGLEVEPFVVMPNHLHGLVSTVGMSSPPVLGSIVGAFKSITARAYRAGADEGRWPPMPNGLWQRGYFDHIIRDETDAAHAMEYIANNPANWRTDRYNL